MLVSNSKVNRSRYSLGFTLIELMVVVGIVALLTMLATPSWKQLILNNRTRAAVNDWVASTQFARAEALRINGAVTLCISTNGINCVTSSTDGFEVGWIVKTGTSANGGKLLQDTLAKDGILMTVSPAALRALTFLPNGLPKGNFAGGHLTVRDSDLTTPDSFNKHICIARTGRARVLTEEQWFALPNGSCAA
jgi:prepilin-type N-terminal cleavage/methylation domain-containing protein